MTKVKTRVMINDIIHKLTLILKTPPAADDCRFAASSAQLLPPLLGVTANSPLSPGVVADRRRPLLLWNWLTPPPSPGVAAIKCLPMGRFWIWK